MKTLFSIAALLLCNVGLFGQVSPIFPSRAVTDADMWVSSDTCVMRLAYPIGPTDTTIQVTTAVGCPTANFLIKIENEVIGISSVSGVVLSVATGGRHYGGTTAAGHARGQIANMGYFSYQQNRDSAEIESLEAFLMTGTGTAAWGHILGTLTDQGDLVTALEGKQNALTDYATISSLSGYPSTFPPTTSGDWTGTWGTHAASYFQPTLSNYSTISGLMGYPSTFPPVNSGNWAGTWQTYSPSYFQTAISGAPGTWPLFGGAALLNVGTTSGTVAAGDDSRFGSGGGSLPVVAFNPNTATALTCPGTAGAQFNASTTLTGAATIATIGCSPISGSAVQIQIVLLQGATPYALTLPSPWNFCDFTRALANDTMTESATYDGTNVVDTSCTLTNGAGDVVTATSTLASGAIPTGDGTKGLVASTLTAAVTKLTAGVPSAAAASDIGGLIGIANPSDTSVVNYVGTDGVQHRIAQSGVLGSLSAAVVKSTSGTPSAAAAADIYGLWSGTKDSSHCTAGDGTMQACAAGGGGGNHYLVFDGSTANPGDGSTLTWSCGSGDGAQCTTTWTVPTGVVAIHVLAWSGGGSGAGSSNGYVGSGGSGGGYEEKLCPVSGTVSIAVGMGGATVSGYNPGLAGGATTVGSCVNVLGGGGGINAAAWAAWPGYISGSHKYGWWGISYGVMVDPTANSGNCRYSGIAMRQDGGGCGGGAEGGTLYPGGSSIGGGGGGGEGVVDSLTLAAGGTSGMGGAGGAGGGYNTGTSAFVACAAGTIPGGGGGAAGTHSGLSGTSCAGARGEVRVMY